MTLPDAIGKALPDAISEALPPDDNLRIGTIATRFPTTVAIQGAVVPASPLASYTPIEGDVVALLRQDATWLILGRTTSSTTGASSQSQAGTENITVAAATSGSANVVFATAFRAVPSVAVNIASAPGASAGWISRGINVTTTGFQIFITGTAGSFTVPVHWQAQEMTQ